MNPSASHPGGGDPPGALSIATTWQGAAAVLSVAGELDLATTPQLRQALEELLSQQPGTVVLDLTGLLFMASVGIAALMWAYSQAAAGGAGFAVVAEGHATLRPLQLTGVTSQVDVYPTLAEAVRALSAD